MDTGPGAVPATPAAAPRLAANFCINAAIREMYGREGEEREKWRTYTRTHPRAGSLRTMSEKMGNTAKLPATRTHLKEKQLLRRNKANINSRK